MENIKKHKIIVIVLHSLNGAGYIVLGYAIFVISGAFTSCSTASLDNDASSCAYALLVCFGVPTIIASAPIIALITYGKVSRAFLKGYSIVIAILFIPIGTIIGVYTIKLLNNSSLKWGNGIAIHSSGQE